jgi:hypothetical protein
MWLTSWLRNQQRSNPGERRRRHGGAHQRATFRPRLEALEDRWLPSQIGLTVTSLVDSGPGTLRAAILTADAGSHSDQFTIGFAVTGTIDLQSPLPALTNSIAIQGPGAGSLTVEEAAGTSFLGTIVVVAEGQTASLSGLTIANGTDDAIFNTGALTISGCTFSGNSGVNGAIFNNSGSMSVSGCTITGNSGVFGGGISNFGGPLTVSGCDLSGNTAEEGGGIFNFGGKLTVSGSTIAGNSAIAGGGIFNSGTATISASTLSGNTAVYGGGIYAAATVGALTVSGSTLSGNSATYGGGIYAFGALTVANTTFTGNSAYEGGGIYNDGATTVRDSVFGGSSTNSSNSAELGGAIFNGVLGTLDVRGSTFSGNTAGDSGGAVYNLGMATVQQCTLSANTAGSAGGGIFNGASGTLAVKDSTVLNNVAPLGADLYNLDALTLDDSTVGVIGP